jgi:ribosomal protein S21
MVKNMTKNKLIPGVGVTKNEKESTGSLSRRFSQKIRRGEVLLKTREKQFYRQKPNKRARRRSALVRAERQKKYKQLRKWGKLK